MISWSALSHIWAVPGNLLIIWKGSFWNTQVALKEKGGVTLAQLIRKTSTFGTSKVYRKICRRSQGILDARLGKKTRMHCEWPLTCGWVKRIYANLIFKALWVLKHDLVLPSQKQSSRQVALPKPGAQPLRCLFLLHKSPGPTSPKFPAVGRTTKAASQKTGLLLFANMQHMPVLWKVSNHVLGVLI